ncbi:immunoglobulin superfamily member 5 [Astyanax mexicanus]|uniref:immunoglobulin superfamily member 5 n=1 Tax=Astyanax mexicanus TaxID=7994 RepID=UPI0020CB0A93|nr:immunoglobulin superfamily member 5 [Astyanax mexicanus]XP_049324996.1 immunoglobulin superfamily member 5 [Astyanax mexicanus]
MDTFALAALLLFISGGVSAEVVLEPQNEWVLRTANASFNCSTKPTGWTIMIWSLNGVLALAIAEGRGVLDGSERFSALNHSTTAQAKWEFIIRNVSRNDAGQVSCQVQSTETVTAGLSVQESGSVEIVGSNRTVMEGDQVVFQCLAAGWFPTPQISWTTNGTPVDQQFFNTSSVEVGTLVNSNSTVRLTAVSNVSVACLASIPALTTPQQSSVLLIVEKVEKPSGIDRTVLIAVTVSVSAVVLIVLIIIAIVFCCKRRRAKSSYQEEARSHARSQTAGDIPTRERQGQDNLGYVTDPKANDTSSELTDSGIWQSSHISTIQMPHVINGSQRDNNLYVSHPVGENGVRKHRHVTIV